MNIEMKMDAYCVGKKRQVMADGKTPYFSLAIMQNGEAGNVSCNETVFDNVEEMQPYSFKSVYRDGQYKGLRIVGFYDSHGSGGNDSQSTSAGKSGK